MAENRVDIVVAAATEQAQRNVQALRADLVGLQQAAGNVAAPVSALATTSTNAEGAMAKWNAEIAAMRTRLQGLTPALGEVGVAAESTLSRMTMLSGGMSGMIVVAADLAGAIGGKLVEAYQKARQEQREYQRAIETADLSKLTKQIEDQTEKLRTLSDVSLRFRNQGGPMALQVEQDVAGRQQEIGGTIAQRQRERERIIFGNAYAAAEGDTKRILDEQEIERLRLRRDQQGLFDFRLHDIDARYAEQQREANRLIGVGQREAAGRLRAAAEEERRVDLFRVFRAPGYAQAAAGYDESLAFSGGVPLPGALARQETISQLARMRTPEYERSREEDLRRAQEAGDEAQAFAGPALGSAGDPARAEQSRRINRELLQIDLQRADVERDRLEGLARIETFSQGEADRMQDLLAAERQRLELRRLGIEIDAQTAIAESTGTRQDQERLEILKQQRDVTAERWALEGAARQRARTERDDPTAGALRGLQDFEEQASRQGERFRMALFQSMSNVGQGITELIVSGLSGDLDRIGDIGKQIGQALMRSLLQELVVTPLVSTLSSTLRSAISSVLGDGRSPVTAGAVGAGAGGGLLGLLGLSPSTASAAAAVGTAPNAPIGSIVQTMAGPGVVTASGQVVLTGGGTVGPVGAAGGDLVAAAASGASPFGGAVSAVPTSSQVAAASSISLSSALVGGAAGALAVGLTAYSASQYATTTQDVAFAGVGGAVSGAAAGAALGNYFGESGYGALIGAVAGAAISAGAAAYGKAKNRVPKAQREQQEVQGVAASFQPMFADLDAAQTPDELYAVVRRYTHAGRGGERQAHGAEDAGLIVSVTFGGRTRRVIDEGVTPDELVANGDTATVSIQAGVAAEAKQPYEERLANAIRQAASRIRTLGSEVRLFFEEALGGGITKTTVLALSRLAEAAGQNINVVQSTLAGLEPDVRAKILERIAQQDVDGALALYVVESGLQAKVKVGEYRRASLAGPGGAPGSDAGGGGEAGAPGPSVAIDPNTGEFIDPTTGQKLSPSELDAILNDASKFGPDGIARIIRDSLLNTSPGGEAGPDGAPTGANSGISSVSFDGPNINITNEDSSVITVTPSVPNPIGELVSEGLQGLGVPAGIANALGLAAESAIGLFGGPIGSLIGLANMVVGQIRQQITQNPGKRTLSLPKITFTPPRSGRGLDVDPEDAISGLQDDGPPGTATVGEPTIADPQGEVTVGAMTDVTTDEGVSVGEGTSGTGGAPGGGPGGASGGTGGPSGEGGASGGVSGSSGSTGGAGDPDGFAEGGWVPGDPSKGDVVPALVAASRYRPLTQGEFSTGPRPILLTGGEHVTRAPAAAAHAADLEEINRDTPGRYPRAATPGTLAGRRSDDVLIEEAMRLRALSHKRNLNLYGDNDRGPLTAAWVP